MRFSIFLLPFLFDLILAKGCKDEPRCGVAKVYGMKGADCFNKSLEHVPQCIADDTEVLELSYNRLRKISKEDFSRYGRLKYLYLYDNSIATIDNETLEELTSLTTLDLGLNILIGLNPLIFHLPSLQRLYLRKNYNMNLAETIEKAKPITSPLTYLDISFMSETERDFVTFPNFGVMPQLETLNISYNFIRNLEPTHFAGLCKLKYLPNENISVHFNDVCDCVRINTWLLSRNVTFTPFGCQVDRNACQTSIDKEDAKLFDECYKKVTHLRKAQTLKKVGIYVGIALLLAVCLVLVFVWKLLKKRRKRKELATTEMQHLKERR